MTVKRRVTVTAADVDEGSLAELRRRVGNLEAFLEGLAAYTAGSSSLTDYGAESTECDG